MNRSSVLGWALDCLSQLLACLDGCCRLCPEHSRPHEDYTLSHVHQSDCDQGAPLTWVTACSLVVTHLLVPGGQVSPC